MSRPELPLQDIHSNETAAVEIAEFTQVFPDLLPESNDDLKRLVEEAQVYTRQREPRDDDFEPLPPVRGLKNAALFQPDPRRGWRISHPDCQGRIDSFARSIQGSQVNYEAQQIWMAFVLGRGSITASTQVLEKIASP